MFRQALHFMVVLQSLFVQLVSGSLNENTELQVTFICKIVDCLGQVSSQSMVSVELFSTVKHETFNTFTS